MSITQSAGRVLSVSLSLSLCVLLLTGCFYSREIASTKRALEYENPGLDLDRKIIVSLGPLSIGFARLIASVIPVDAEDETEFDQARWYMKYVKRIKVGVYDVNFDGDQYSLRLPQELLEDHMGHGWEQLAKVREDGEQVWLFYKSEGDEITELYTVVNSGEELGVAKIKGDFTALIERAVADHVDWTELMGDTMSDALEF